MSPNNESAPETKHFLLLGESEKHFYLGFRDEVTKKFSGLELNELDALGIKDSAIDGVAIDHRDENRVAAVRFLKTEFDDSSDLEGPRGGFRYEFAETVATKLGGYVCSRDIERLPARSDKAFIPLVQAKVDRSHRMLENEALGDE